MKKFTIFTLFVATLLCLNPTAFAFTLNACYGTDSWFEIKNNTSYTIKVETIGGSGLLSSGTGVQIGSKQTWGGGNGVGATAPACDTNTNSSDNKCQFEVLQLIALDSNNNTVCSLNAQVNFYNSKKPDFWNGYNAACKPVSGSLQFEPAVQGGAACGASASVYYNDNGFTRNFATQLILTVNNS